MSRTPQNDRANAMYKLYNDGYSLEKVASTFGVSRQTVYKMFARRGLSLRGRPDPLPYVLFQGEKYTLRKNGYYGKTRGSRSYLHRDIWEHHFGTIPDDYDVHHKDENKTNNRIDNFELLEKAEHARLYGKGHNQFVNRKTKKAQDT